MIGLISFYQMIIMLWVGFWPKFACTWNNWEKN